MSTNKKWAVLYFMANSYYPVDWSDLIKAGICKTSLTAKKYLSVLRRDGYIYAEIENGENSMYYAHRSDAVI